MRLTSWLSVLSNSIGRNVKTSGKRRKGQINRAFEQLEERCLLTVDLVSRGLPSDTSDGDSYASSMSADGRYVAFTSYATNLVNDDLNGQYDVFVRDLQTGTTTLVSTSADDVQGNSGSFEPSISDDGRYVAFRSNASNLVSGDTNGLADVFVKDLQTGAITRISTDANGVQGDSESIQPALSGNGRFVAFQSYASNLVSGDTNGNQDIFVKDLQTGTIVRATTDAGGVQGNGYAYGSSISDDGRYVAFSSEATNLVGGDTNGRYDVFVKDLQTGAVTRASTDASNSQANIDSYQPSLSGDGRYVAFPSYANNLVAADTNGTPDVFRKDLQTGAIVRVSVDANNVEANNASYESSISDDGRYVAFRSYAANLVTGDTNGRSDIFRKDLQTGAILRLSSDSSNAQANSDSYEPDISDDGQFTTFQSTASNLADDDYNASYDVFIKDAVTATTVLVSKSLVTVSSSGNYGSFQSAISGDGRYVAFVSGSTNLVTGDTNGFDDIFVNDLETGTIVRASTSSSGVQANYYSYEPSISSDGRYVVFFSYASNLVPGDTNGTEDIFRKDLQTGELIRVSTDAGNGQSNGASVQPAISADGRYVAFYSNATNLVSGDTNGTSDIFVKDLQTGVVVRASTDSFGTQGNYGAERPSISNDGRYVAFHTYASNLVSGDTNNRYDVFVKDLQTGATVRASTDSSGVQTSSDSYQAQISGNGRYVSFYSYASNLVPGDTNGRLDVFVKDLQTGAVVRASTDGSGLQGNSDSYESSISSDGRYVAFYSYATNLVTGDTNGTTDIFVKDLQSGAVTRASVTAANGQANNYSYLPSISGDGRYVSFISQASNLSPLDRRSNEDVFRASLFSGSLSATVDGSGNLTIDDTTDSNNDFTLTADSGNLVLSDANEQFSAAPAGWTLSADGKSISIAAGSFTGAIIINGAGGDDTLTLDYSGGDVIPAGGMSFNGDAGNNAVRVVGSGLGTDYTPDATTAGDGTLTIEGMSLAFTGLAPIDYDVVGGTFTLTLSGADDIVDISNSTLIDGVTDALKISGSTGGVAFENARVRGSAIIIDTTAVAGTDTITVTNADNGHGDTSLTITAGTEAGDNITVNGTATFSGTTTLDAKTIDLKAAITNAATGSTATVVNVSAAGQIQDGVNVAASSATVNVAAGTYTENVSINKSLTLRGANAGVAGDDVRGAESIIRSTGLSNTAVVGVTAANVTINGFTLDGDDPAFAGVALASGDNANASYGVRPTGAVSNLTVSNNIITHVEIGLRGDVASQGNTITRNWFDSVGHYDFGYAVSLRTNFYADVTDNKMTRVWTGVHVNNHSGATGPASWSISGNEIESYAGGILYWLQYNGATSATISNNLITAATGAATNNAGIEIVSIADAVSPTLTGNSISDTDYGVILTNVSTSNVISFNGTNSVTGTKIAGLYLTDNLTFNPVGTTDLTTDAYTGPGNAIAVALTGMPISVASGVGVKVETSRTLAADVSTSLSISGTTTITGGTTGLLLSGADTHVTGNTLNDTQFTGQTDYIRFQNGAVDNVEIDATSVKFDGLVGSTATLAQNYAIENKLFHATDDGSVGFVRVKDDNVFVTNASGSIQRGIDAAVDGDTVVIQPGTNTGAVSAAARAVTLAPDATAPGQIVVNGDLALSGDDVLQVQLNGLNPSTQFDNFLVTGSVTLNGATLSPSLGFAPQPLDRFTIIANDTSSDAVTGIFNGLAEGAIITVGATRLRVSYIENHAGFGDGNDVSLTVMTPPVSVSFSNGSLTINGTGLVDDITIDVTGTNSVTLTGNDVTNFTGVGTNGQAAGPYIVTGSIFVNTGNGNDTVLLRGLGGAAKLNGSVSIDLGAGNDTLTTIDTGVIPNPTTGLTLGGALSVLGGTGDDVVTLGSAAANDSFKAGSISVDTGTGVVQTVNIDRTTTVTTLTVKNSGTGAQTVALGAGAANTVGGNLTITQADGASGYSVDVIDTNVGGLVQITNGNGSGAAIVNMDTTIARVVTGTTTITNGNNASNEINLIGTTGSLQLTGNVTAKNGNATISNEITVTDLSNSGGSASSFTNGTSPANVITFDGALSNTFVSTVAATNGISTGTNAITATRLSSTKGLTFINGNATTSAAMTLGGTAASSKVAVTGNSSLTNGNAAALTMDIDGLTTTGSAGAGNVTLRNGTSAGGGTSVRIGANAGPGANTLAGNLSIANLASTGARLVGIDRTTVNGTTGVSVNETDGGDSTLNVGTSAAVVIAAKLDIQDGTGNSTVSLNTLTAGSITYNDLGGGVDVINLANSGGNLLVSGITRLTTGNGSDIVNIASAGGSASFNDSVFISLGAGDDSLTIGSGAGGMAFSTANKFQFDGAAGFDTITVNPSAIGSYTPGSVPAKLKSLITNFERIL